MRKNNIPDPVIRVVEDRDRFFCPVEDCPHEKASAEGYLTRRAYRRHFDAFHLQSETVGFISRVDWGSPGFRKGLLELAFQRLEKEQVRFIIWGGGLISFPHLRGEMNATNLRMVARDHDLYTTTLKGKKTEDTARAREFLLNKWAAELALAIPRIRRKRGYVKIYVVTSPAPNYDGWIGAEVARRLVRIRSDIRFWGERSARFPLKRQNKTLGVLAPMKSSWRSKYYSTAVDRLIEDEERQTSQELPDMWVVGCTASALQRPAGEKKRPYISIPGLHRLQEVHTAENQIGTRVIEFFPEDRFVVRTYTFKDLVAEERRFIPNPNTGDELQQQTVAEMKHQEKLTIGMLEDTLRVSRSKIAKAIEALNESGYEPRVLLDADSQLYEFDSHWIQNSLAYPKINLDKLREDTILGFGCLHAGSVFSEYRFFVEKVPQLAIEHGVNVLVGAGDFIEGLQHDLDKRGEVMRGWNYTDQETLAAREVAAVMGKIFKARFERLLNGRKRKPSQEELWQAVDSCLIRFLYREGNHDGWLARDGVTPLATFHPALVKRLTENVEEVLHEHGLELIHLSQLVETKVSLGEVHELPSGLGVTILHPHMARAQTSSLRAQHTLDLATTPAVILANFHVAMSVEQWDGDLGQRVAVQIGALVWKTSFEHSKLKRLDVGVGYLRILSDEEGRILMSETAFFGGGDREELSNDDLLDSFMTGLGV